MHSVVTVSACGGESEKSTSKSKNQPSYWKLLAKNQTGESKAEPRELRAVELIRRGRLQQVLLIPCIPPIT